MPPPPAGVAGNSNAVVRRTVAGRQCRDNPVWQRPVATAHPICFGLARNVGNFGDTNQAAGRNLHRMLNKLPDGNEEAEEDGGVSHGFEDAATSLFRSN